MLHIMGHQAYANWTTFCTTMHLLEQPVYGTVVTPTVVKLIAKNLLFLEGSCLMIGQVGQEQGSV